MPRLRTLVRSKLGLAAAMAVSEGIAKRSSRESAWRRETRG
jgi:hypothetical protein